MNNTSPPAARLRPGTRGTYTDTAAMNNIHAMITSRTGAATAALECITEILARSGRLIVPARHIIATVDDDEHGLPVARIDGDGTYVTVHQGQAGPGLRIQIRTCNDDERAALVIELDGVILDRGSSARSPTWTRRTRPHPAPADRGAAVRGHARKETGHDCS
jgi:hypothetical protein